jgi:hypothetical protein
MAPEESAAATRSDFEMPEIPASLRALMAELGPKWRDDTAGHVDRMITAFSEVLKLIPRDGVTSPTVRMRGSSSMCFCLSGM